MNLTETRYGQMLYPANDTVIGRSLECYGEWAQSEIDFLEPHCLGGLVLDVGANVGSHTLAFAQRATEVWAFEPQRLIFQALCGNLALNHLRNVKVFPVAVGPTAGEVCIQAFEPEEPTNHGCAHIVAEGERVSQITIDALNLPACQLIKMDIEGYEPQALLGALDTLKRHRPKLYLEAHCEREPLYELLEALDYRWEPHAAPCFNPHNFKGHPVDYFNGFVEENLFAWPV